MHKNLLIGIVVLVLVVSGGIIFKPKANKSDVQSQAEEVVADIEKQMDQKEGSSGILVPENLQDCPADWFQSEAGRERILCDESIKTPYCSYYTLEKDGVTKTKVLEFTSECAVCRNHKKKGEVFIDGSAGKYTHLGYQKGECTQGMYKK